MGMWLPETCWAVFKRQVINLRSCCILLVDSVQSSSETSVPIYRNWWFHIADGNLPFHRRPKLSLLHASFPTNFLYVRLVSCLTVNAPLLSPLHEQKITNCCSCHRSPVPVCILFASTSIRTLLFWYKQTGVRECKVAYTLSPWRGLNSPTGHGGTPIRPPLLASLSDVSTWNKLSTRIPIKALSIPSGAHSHTTNSAQYTIHARQVATNCNTALLHCMPQYVRTYVRTVL